MSENFFTVLRFQLFYTQNQDFKSTKAVKQSSFIFSSKFVQSLSENQTPEFQIHLNTKQYGCPVFKWLCHMTWRTILIPDILDQNRPFSVRFSDQHSNTGPFDNFTQILSFEYQTSPIFRWLLFSPQVKGTRH